MQKINPAAVLVGNRRCLAQYAEVSLVARPPVDDDTRRDLRRPPVDDDTRRVSRRQPVDYDTPRRDLRRSPVDYDTPRRDLRRLPVDYDTLALCLPRHCADTGGGEGAFSRAQRAVRLLDAR